MQGGSDEYASVAVYLALMSLWIEQHKWWSVFPKQDEKMRNCAKYSNRDVQRRANSEEGTPQEPTGISAEYSCGSSRWALGREEVRPPPRIGHP